MLFNKASAFKLIAPEPFSVVNKNYLKVQLLAEKGDAAPDSVFFDVLYNMGSLVHRANASMSYVLPLNEFNDGVFYIRSRVYRNGICDTIGSAFDREGVPVILDRHAGRSDIRFVATYGGAANSTPYDFRCNNNHLSFSGHWDEDSLYFNFAITDAQLNDAPTGTIDLFQARNYLKTLWESDCIELGLDLGHEGSLWKDRNDYELLVDVRGNIAGNRWSVQDSLYEHWGEKSNVQVTTSGTLNNNLDTDSGYQIAVAIPWSELNFNPLADQEIGFDIQLYDKDGSLDEAFRTSISGTNPESNDNTSEWTTLVLEKKEAFFSPLRIGMIVGAIGLIIIFFRLRRKKAPASQDQEKLSPASTVAKPLSELINKSMAYIHANYQNSELSRQQIAEQVFISEKYLSSMFKKEVGMNLMNYINKFRIDRSIELLKERKLTISEIAFAVGYNSLQNFNKNFKVITGKTPSEYRRS